MTPVTDIMDSDRSVPGLREVGASIGCYLPDHLVYEAEPRLRSMVR
jgi:hypothetical protein